MHVQEHHDRKKNTMINIVQHHPKIRQNQIVIFVESGYLRAFSFNLRNINILIDHVILITQQVSID